MLQTINALHQFSVVNPSLYFGALLCMLLIVLRGWYILGVLNSQAWVSPAQQSAPARQRVVLYKKGQVIVLHVV
jgi:hypothetical protein